MVTIADRAIRWYANAARDLPWRRPGTSAWGVLVSEVMLQQTQVNRVIPAWEQWLGAWPTPTALAAVSPGEAIRAWGRLGYPRRAVRLHECATVLAIHHGGTVPADVTTLLGLPGIGQYTARAVAAFAYQQRHPVVDTNVRRLIARASGGRADGGPATTPAHLAAVLAELPANPARAARASVAFMELGALLCTSRNPACDRCPLRAECAWRRAGQPAAAAGPARRSPGYVGTDRQVRGLLLGLVRDSEGPVPGATLDLVWHDHPQRQRALAGLLADGLMVEVEPGWYVLPGDG
ncbi:MAG TPA: A/G-specific adenine glycosylase [Micromonosporaceae bacterium]